MKYQLINKINNSWSAIEQVLHNRGIDDIQHYLNTSDQDINSFYDFGKDTLLYAGAALVRTIAAQQKAIVIVDSDCDGFTSSAVLINYLHDVFPQWVENKLDYTLHSGKQHGLNDHIDHLLTENYSLVLVPDAGSNDVEECKKLKEKNIEVIILDHHICDLDNPYAYVINNQLSNYPNKELSGVGVTWQFCRYLDLLLFKNYADQYLDLVALGNDADMMSMTSIETKHLINKGLKQVQNPFIAYMHEKNKFSLGENLTPIGVAFYIAPFVNAIVRSGTLEEKTLVFNSMLKFLAFKEIPSTKRGHLLGEKEKLVEQAVRVATNVKARQTKAQDAGMAKIEQMIEDQDLLLHKVLLFLLEPDEIDKNIAGLIANKIMAKYQRPVCILTETRDQDGISYQGSARGCDKVGVVMFKDICAATGVCMYTAGHEGAFGLGIKQKDIQTFIEKTDAALKDMSDETIYYVDYIYKGANVKPQNILDIASMENFWGKDVDEALVAIENLKVSADMVTVYNKKDITIKISLPNNISLMIFKAKDSDVEKLQTNNIGYVEINVVGKCNANEWLGNVTPQIFIEQYEIIDSNKYFF